MREVFIGILSFFISALVTRLMIAVGRQDIPNERSSHQTPTPKGGGVGIIVSFYLSLLVLDSHALPFLESWSLWIGLLAGGVVSAIVSFMDDIKTLPPLSRLLLQISIVFCFMGIGAKISVLTFPLFGEVELGYVEWLITFLWMVGFMNAYNFMDGLDGMIGGTTLVTSSFLALIFFFHLNYVFYTSCLILFAATAGFIGYNVPRARIFIGEVGSQSLGFLFGGLAVISGHSDFGKISFWTFPLLFFIFLYDTAFTVILRGVQKKNILMPHREFLFHLLHRTGWSHFQVSAFYSGIALLQGIAAYLMQFYHPSKHVYFFLPFLGGAIAYTIWVLKRAQKAGIMLMNISPTEALHAK